MSAMSHYMQLLLLCLVAPQGVVSYTYCECPPCKQISSWQLHSVSDSKITGEEVCEGHGFNPAQCQAIGCCQWDNGQCRSAVGVGPCDRGGSRNPSPTEWPWRSQTGGPNRGLTGSYYLLPGHNDKCDNGHCLYRRESDGEHFCMCDGGPVDYVPCSYAVCIFDGQLKGQLNLFHNSRGLHGHRIRIEGEVSGLTDLTGAVSNSLHGFHIHQRGDLGNSCKNAGGHFNPGSDTHGSPMDPTRHTGDLGNIKAVDGVGRVEVVDNMATLTGVDSVLGRAIVIHAGRDDLGRGGDLGSTKTGNAGPRIGCCVITEP